MFSLPLIPENKKVLKIVQVGQGQKFNEIFFETHLFSAKMEDEIF